MSSKIKILITSAAILIVGGIGLGLMFGGEKADQAPSDFPQLNIEEARFDLGDVSMADGLAFYSLQIKNKGAADLKINSIKTSCMCTEVVLEVDGRQSPKFGMHSSSAFWSETIRPGQSAQLKISYDPNAHGPNALGPVTRGITIISNSGGKSGARNNITFTANVVK